MTNREQITWSLGFFDYDNREIARIISDMLDATGVAYLDGADQAQLEKWLGLYCDSETNNWGELGEEALADV